MLSLVPKNKNLTFLLICSVYSIILTRLRYTVWWEECAVQKKIISHPLSSLTFFCAEHGRVVSTILFYTHASQTWGTCSSFPVCARGMLWDSKLCKGIPLPCNSLKEALLAGFGGTSVSCLKINVWVCILPEGMYLLYIWYLYST